VACSFTTWREIPVGSIGHHDYGECENDAFDWLILSRTGDITLLLRVTSLEEDDYYDGVVEVIPIENSSEGANGPIHVRTT
jgi:hypothetical protein